MTEKRPSSARALVWTALFLAGLAGWIACTLGADADRAWRALLINFIYFTPLAAGMVVWPAVALASRGRWAESLERSALAGISFAPVSLAAFAALWLGRTHWAAWLRYKNLPNAAWLSSPFLFSRDAVALAVLWALAAWFAARARAAPGQEGKGRPNALACWLVGAYCAAFTLLGFDLVMALNPHWFSTLFGGYFFISGMYAAVAAWTLVAIAYGPVPEVERLHDLGKLIVAFSLLTVYMMYSQLIVIWYENLPHEAGNVVARLRFERWGWVSAGLLAVVYMGPLIILLPRRAKRNRRFLGAVALCVLAGLWVERWWLVTPASGGKFALGWTEGFITAAFVAAWALGVEFYLKRAPSAPAQEAE